ncbi:MAG: NUDIX domain-containing protein [Desulfobacterales bacterium]|nr:NUDIX domain-containing protein [Desulfobacterales bacterium]
MDQKNFCHFCGGRLIRKHMEGRQRRFCAACNLPIYENPVPATCVVVVGPDGRLALVKRAVDPKKGMWCLPGGFMELGETPEQAAARELEEETGLRGRMGPLLGVIATPNRDYDTVLMVGYLVTDPTGVLIAGDDADQCRWFSPAALPPIAFSSHQTFIETYLARPRAVRRTGADFPCDNDIL